MDYEPYGYEGSPQSGFRRINRIVAKCDGETHIYQYAPDLTDDAIKMVKLHVEEGQLHPYAGIMVVKMIRECEHDD